MPRYKGRKTDRGLFSPAIMSAAVKRVNENNEKIKTVATATGLNRNTLRRYARMEKLNPRNIGQFHPNYATHHSIFTPNEEIKLVEYLLKADAMYQGLSRVQIKKLGYEFAVRLRKKVQNKDYMLGTEWFNNFMRRQSNLSLRKPEGNSLQRDNAFNRNNVNAFFDNLVSLFEKVNPPPSKIFNLDETGLLTVSKVVHTVASKGARQVGQLTSAEEGTTVTLCGCIAADGRALPPALIFPRVNVNPRMSLEAPPNTLVCTHPSGWMTSVNFVLVIQHFISHMYVSKESPGILLFDDHESHLSLEIVDLARDNGLHILIFPPHTSHKLQPLDKTVYGPLKTYIATATQELLSQKGPGFHLSIYEIPYLLSRVFGQAFSYGNIISGFRATGCSPLNRFIFTDADFVTADALDIPFTASDPTKNTAHTIVRPTSPVANAIECSPRPHSHSTSSDPVTPEIMRPFKKPEPKNAQLGGQKPGKTRILTSTPEKRMLHQFSDKKLSWDP